MKQTYYYELKAVMNGPLRKEFTSDEEAVKELTKRHGSSLEIIYRESGSLEERPFRNLYP